MREFFRGWRRWLLRARVALILLLLVGCAPIAAPVSKDRFGRWQGGGLYSGGMAYQPDDDRLVVSIPTSGRGDLWQLSCDGSQATLIRETPESEVDPSVSKSGLLHYAKFVEGRYVVCSYDLTTEEESVEVEVDGHAVAPVALPDGSAVLFVRNGKTNPASLSEIWEKSLRTQEMRRLTSNYVMDGLMSCFQDSRRILFCSGGEEAQIMDLQSKECRFVCKGTQPLLSEDERTVFVVRKHPTSNDWEFWSHDLASGAERSYPFQNGLVMAACTLPEGKIAAVFCDAAIDRVGQIAILDQATAKWTPLGRVLDVVQK